MDMLKFARSRAFWLDYFIAAVAGAAMFGTAQFLEVATVQNAVGWWVIIIAYGFLTKTSQLYGWAMAILSSTIHNVLIPITLLVWCAGWAFAFAAAIAFVPPHVVQVHDWVLFPLVATSGALLQTCLISFLQPLRVAANSADIRAENWLSVETPWNQDDQTHSIYRSHKHVRGDLIIVPREELGRVCNLLGMALMAAATGELERCNKLCDEALPDLHRCGYTGETKVSIGYAVIRQSAKAHKIEHLKAYANRMVAQCSLMLQERVRNERYD